MADHAVIAGYNRKAPRRAVNLSLNEDLVQQAKDLTRNLSGTVEELLAGYVASEQARKQAEDDQLENVINALNERHKRDGFLSDEFSNF
ncbi:MAG TPA: type II toxin-antitoxin system CcdA family antitoxin [Rhodopila sp.]|jgi:antitoxin CcdA